MKGGVAYLFANDGRGAHETAAATSVVDAPVSAAPASADTLEIASTQLPAWALPGRAAERRPVLADIATFERADDKALALHGSHHPQGPLSHPRLPASLPRRGAR